MNQNNDIAGKLSNLSDKQKALLALRMKKQHQDEKKAGSRPLYKMEREGRTEFLSSYSQKRFWFLDQWSTNKATNHTHLVTKLEGKLNVEALQYALNEIVQRHEVLGMTYKSMDYEVYCVPKENAGCLLEVKKVKGLTAKQKEENLNHLTFEALTRPFDLEKDIPIRAVLLEMGKDVHYLIIVVHHIASDMWSLRIVKKEIQEIYNARVEGKDYALPVPEFQYMDFANWQREKIDGNALPEVEAYKNSLTGVPPYLRLVSDYKRPDVQTNNGSVVRFVLEAKLMEDIKALCGKEGLTPYIFTMAGFSILMSKYSNMDDFVVGSPVAGRTTKGVENIIGLFINTLAIRTNLSANPTIKELLEQIKGEVGKAFACQEYPFERLVHELNVPQNLSYTPIFQVMFNYQSIEKEVLALTGLKAENTLPVNNTSKFDINVAVKIMQGEAVVEFTYNTDLFKKATIEKMINNYQYILKQMVENLFLTVKDVEVLTEEEKKEIIDKYSITEITDYEDIPYMHKLFERCVKEYPEDAAVVCDGVAYTYAQLNAKANQLARYLRTLGVRAEVPVGLFVERSLDLSVGILGILKAGGAYVPLDPIYPSQRVSYIAKDAKINIVITQKHLVEILNEIEEVNFETVVMDEMAEKLASYDENDFDCGLKPENLFYILYTSGSTGNPKGVAIEHRNYINYYFGITKRMNIEPKLRYAIASTFAADLATINVWAALSTGGTIHILNQELSVDPIRYAKYFRDNRIDVIKMVPSHFKSLKEMANLYDIIPNRLLILAGEASHWDMIEEIKAAKPTTNVQIHYGPTETTVSMLAYSVTGEKPHQYTDTMPLGRPIPNVSIYVLDDRMRIVPKGVPGELYIGGKGLARGYYNHEELTAKSFVENPFENNPSERLYKTGDSVRMLEDGTIEFLGRVDEQVKVKGFRIELGEINTELLSCEGVKDAYAMVREDVPGEKVIVAYIVGDEAEVSINDIRNKIRSTLPHYMVPSAFVLLERMPLNANGKVNKFELPKPDTIAMVSEAEYEPPENETEERLAEVWSKVLGIERIGVNDNFFSLGGDSFKAVAVIREFEGCFSIMDIFRYSTMRELAPRVLQGASGSRELLYNMSLEEQDEEEVALICVPFAGGSAIAYKELAEKMRKGIGVYAIQIPGHDFSQKNEELLPIREVALKCLEEIKEKVKGHKVAIYGHCLGGALGIELARLVEKEEALELAGIFMGGNFPASILPGKFFKMWNKLFPRDKRISNRAYMDMLRSLGGFAEELAEDERNFIIRSLRHDRRESEKYYCECYDDPDFEKIHKKMLCVVGELDRTTEFYPEQYRDWEYFCDDVDVEVIPNAGHYFFKHQASVLAEIIEKRLDMWENPAKEVKSFKDPIKDLKVKPSLTLFSIFMLGQFISSIGTSFMGFALGLWVRELTGKTSAFAITLVFNRLPGILVLPFAGTIADKFDRRKILILSNIGSAIVVGVLASLAFTGNLQVYHIYMANAFVSFMSGFQRPASLASVAQITPKKYLGQANGIVQLSTSMADVIAMPLSGILTVIGIEGIITINLVSFVICIATLCMIAFPDTMYHREDETFLRQMAYGWRFITKRKSFVSLVVFFAVANLLLGIGYVLITPYIKSIVSLTWTGVVSALIPVGGLIGGVLMGLWGGTKNRGEGMILFDVLLGVGFLFMGLSQMIVFLIIGTIAYGVSMALVNAHWQTLIQSKVRQELLARIFAINQMFALPTIPLGYYIGGILSDEVVGPWFQNNSWPQKSFGWLVGEGELCGDRFIFIVVGLTIVVWALLCYQYKPLRYMDEIMPDALPGPILIRDLNQLQKEEDYQLEMLKIREKQVMENIKQRRGKRR